MAVTSVTRAQRLGKVLAELRREEPLVAELWTATQADAVQFWVIAREPIPMAEHRRLYGLTGALYDRCPDATFEVHVLNPRNYIGDVHRALPRNAVQLPV